VQVVPAVDVLAGKAVRLVKGDYRAVTEYSDDPVAVATSFVEQGAKLIHIVDLNAARGRRRSLDVARALGDTGIPFQIGGGVRDPSSAHEALSAGAVRVVVGSVLLGDPAEAQRIVHAVGAERIVGAVDVREGRARGSGWLDEGVALRNIVERLDDLGIHRVLVTGIDTDGTMEGPALDLFSAVRELAPNLVLISSGGVGSLDDIRSLAASAVQFEAVIVGRALYENRFTLADAVVAAGHSFSYSETRSVPE
jgi:phosphoribosylformimino-5-aminoimidazole carboxamide ribotide isomerase